VSQNVLKLVMINSSFFEAAKALCSALPHFQSVDSCNKEYNGAKTFGKNLTTGLSKISELTDYLAQEHFGLL